MVQHIFQDWRVKEVHTDSGVGYVTTFTLPEADVNLLAHWCEFDLIQPGAVVISV